jgi:hypothetical protein
MKNCLQYDTISFVEQVLTAALRPGDLWITGLDYRFWILIQKQESKLEIDGKSMSVWNMTWFGKKGQDSYGLINDTWIDGSSFKILSRGV